MRMRILTWVAVISCGAFFATPVFGQEIDLRITQVSGTPGVVDINHAGDGSGRLFMVQQSGRIMILKDGQDLVDPFLQIGHKLANNDTEQGLLSVEFAPDYASSGYFYVWYTESGGATVLSRFKVSDDPNVADSGSEEVILRVFQPFGNHNGGRLRFGPDGMLYVSLGDGGGANDPDGNAQNGGSLLGKLLRIDVDPVHGTYAIPPDNPFVNNPAVHDEIWASGLRNPWRISFDSVTGDLFIADVGQNQWEEINVQPGNSTGGENYGWNITEGAHCAGGGSCNLNDFTLPVMEYGHSEGCSITGGEVYRGAAYPGLHGVYLFSDYCTGTIWGMVHDGNNWTRSTLLETNKFVPTFGLGEDGSIYVAGQPGGVYLLSDGEVTAEPSFNINSGLNDAWFDPATAGQGFFITVFEDTGIVFLAWFTYDVERPPEDVTAILGEPGHRWVTAQGPFTGDTAMLDVFITSGGVFDSPEPAVGPPARDGTMTIKWDGCGSGLLTYDIPSAGEPGSVPIQRIVPDNIPLCEALLESP